MKIENRTKILHSKNISRIFKLGLFTFLFMLVSLYVVNAPRYAIDQILTSEKQAIFGIIAMPSTIMILLGNFLVQPFLTRLLDRYSNKDKKSFLKIITGLISVIIICSIIILTIAYFIGILVLEFIYGTDLSAELNNLLIIICGATLYTITLIISNILIMMRKTGIQLIIYLITAVFAFFISRILVTIYGLNGGVLFYFVTMTIQFFLFIIVFITSINLDKKLTLCEEANNE